MEIKIRINKEPYKEITTLMHNIKEINKGDEIGGWLLGKWENNGKELELTLDKFIIPKQDVSGTEVDISPESMIDTIKEIGTEEGNRIKAHWHIHPFGKGNTNWSGVDEEKIEDFMHPEKQRDIFVFLLSSEDQIKARVEIRLKGKVNGMETPITLTRSIDNLPVLTEETENKEIIEKLKERVKEKIKRAEPITSYWSPYINYKKTVRQSTHWNKRKFDIDATKETVEVLMEEELEAYIYQNWDRIPTELVPNDTRQSAKGKRVWIYDEKDKKKQKILIKELKKSFETIRDEMTSMGKEEEDEWERPINSNYRIRDYYYT